MAIILLDQVERKSIQIQTLKGTAIDNYQVFEFSDFERNQFANFAQKYQSVRFRNSPSPVYNCHGMTFASRRSCIDDTSVINSILQDDGYVKVMQKDTLPGDIVLYLSEDGDIEHSGTLVVCEHPENSLPILSVLSKWGKFKEAIHDINNSPYNGLTKEFYRLNHAEYEGKA